jgi:hypothetical protein
MDFLMLQKPNDRKKIVTMLQKPNDKKKNGDNVAKTKR